MPHVFAVCGKWEGHQNLPSCDLRTNNFLRSTGVDDSREFFRFILNKLSIETSVAPIILLLGFEQYFMAIDKEMMASGSNERCRATLYSHV